VVFRHVRPGLNLDSGSTELEGLIAAHPISRIGELPPWNDGAILSPANQAAAQTTPNRRRGLELPAAGARRVTDRLRWITVREMNSAGCVALANTECGCLPLLRRRRMPLVSYLPGAIGSAPKALEEDIDTGGNRYPPLNRRPILSYGETRAHAIALPAR
jgi:hypothetical protein